MSVKNAWPGYDGVEGSVNMGVEVLIIAAGSCERARNEALNMQNSPLAAALVLALALPAEARRNFYAVLLKEIHTKCSCLALIYHRSVP